MYQKRINLNAKGENNKKKEGKKRRPRPRFGTPFLSVTL